MNGGGRLRQRRRPPIRALATLLAALSLSRTAEAREPANRLPVELEIDPCTGVGADVVERVLTVELGVSVTTVPVGGASDPAQKTDTTQVTLACDEGTIRMTVRDPLSGKTLERHVDLRAERSSARPRLLGLSAAELVAASWIELDATPKPSVPIVEAVGPPPARAEAAATARATALRRQPMAWDLEAVAAGRRFPSTGLTTWGAGIAGTWAYQGWLALGGELLAETGSATVWHDGNRVGTATLRSGSGKLSARLRKSWQYFAIEGGIGGRLSLTHLSASAEDANWVEHPFTRVWGGPVAEIRLAWKPSRGTLLMACLEGGTVTRQLAALVAKESEPVISGAWAGLSLGFGIGGDGLTAAR